MLEKPEIPDRLVIERLRDEFGLQVRRLSFLPLGADVNTAVYHVLTDSEQAFFLKLRKGASPAAWGAGFAPEGLDVLVPQFLYNQGITAIIAPLEARGGQPWATLDAYKMILYPFIEGKDGYDVPLTAGQWQEFGAALRSIHSARVPPGLARLIPRETYSSRGRDIVRSYQAQVEARDYRDPAAAQMAAFMKARRREIDRLVQRAEELSLALSAHPPEYVLCHSDVHPGNLLIPTPSEEAQGETTHARVYIVDWDTPLFAPKERDLLLIGGCSTWNGPREEALFYLGYAGDPDFQQKGLDPIALAYYRCERIIQDIAEFCQQLLESEGGGEDREQSLMYFESNFLPGHEIELALRTDPEGVNRGKRHP